MDLLRMRLRAATAPLHERVDAAFSAFQLDQIDGYRAFLRAHAQVIGPLEVVLEASGIDSMLVDWPLRRRRHELVADLEELDECTRWSTWPVTALEPGWCWGAAYVIEGSRLGGRVLAGRVANANPEAPLRYLGPHDTAPSWKSFVDQFEQQAVNCPWDVVLAGALEVFERFVSAAATQRC